MPDWHQFAESLWGSGEKLGAASMAVRALAMFFIVLVLLRLGGARTFAKKSPFDNVIVIMLGAVAARGVVGASPFGSTVAASAVMIAVHRVLARLCVTNRTLARLLNGAPIPLYTEGRLLLENLKRTTISEGELLESHRLETQRPELGAGEQAFLEPNGRVSFVEKPDRPQGSGDRSNDA